MNVRYRVELSQTERDELAALLAGGKHAVRKLKRAQILLAADAGVDDETIAKSVAVGGSTVYRTKRRFVEGNLEAALSEEPRPGGERKLNGKEEALLVATACSDPPKGRKRWTLELLADAMVLLTAHDGLSRETIRRRLAENDLKPWRRDMWCIPEVDGAYVARMEDVLDLYAEGHDPKRPVVCFDESPHQLIGEARQPIPAEPGQPERYDCEYRRNGTVNLFVFLDAHRPWRRVKVTEQRTAQDFAKCMRDLVDLHYPQADVVQVVLDNLSTHSPGALYETFPAPEAHRIMRRLEFHFTPSTPVGSTWSKSRSACCAPNASTAASTKRTGSSPKLPHGNISETSQAPASNGCSQPSAPGPNWLALIQPPSKSHNRCAELLGRVFS